MQLLLALYATLGLLLFNIKTVMSHVLNVDFHIRNGTTQSQTILLASMLTNSTLYELNDQTGFFKLHSKANRLYLELDLRQKRSIGKNYQLELVSPTKVTNLNVSIHQQQKVVANNFSIEYMFKFKDEDETGLIKADMMANGVLAIIKLASDLTLHVTSEDFHVRKFLPKFYMLRLSRDASQLDSSRVISVAIERLITLRFRVVNLTIELNKATFAQKSLPESTCMGRLVNIFEYVPHADVEYQRKNFRFGLETTNCEQCFELDPQNGRLHMNSMDREYFKRILGKDEVFFLMNFKG